MNPIKYEYPAQGKGMMSLTSGQGQGPHREGVARYSGQSSSVGQSAMKGSSSPHNTKLPEGHHQGKDSYAAGVAGGVHSLLSCQQPRKPPTQTPVVGVLGRG